MLVFLSSNIIHWNLLKIGLYLASLAPKQYVWHIVDAQQTSDNEWGVQSVDWIPGKDMANTPGVIMKYCSSMLEF